MHKALIGAMGMRFGKTLMCEENRQSTWEYAPDDVRILCGVRDSFLRKGIEAYVFGVHHPRFKRIRYAVFVEDGFLTPLPAGVCA